MSCLTPCLVRNGVQKKKYKGFDIAKCGTNISEITNCSQIFNLNGIIIDSNVIIKEGYCSTINFVTSNETLGYTDANQLLYMHFSKKKQKKKK